jgi:hypothetical protein
MPHNIYTLVCHRQKKNNITHFQNQRYVLYIGIFYVPIYTMCIYILYVYIYMYIYIYISIYIYIYIHISIYISIYIYRRINIEIRKCSYYISKPSGNQILSKICMNPPSTVCRQRDIKGFNKIKIFLQQ